MKVYDAGGGKTIKVFDDLFDYKYKTNVYRFAESSLFRIGWADSPINENLKYRFLHSDYSNEDLQRLGITENITIKPITNRMIVFSPNINHKVEPYTGTRLSVAVNPWTTKPMTHR